MKRRSKENIVEWATKSVSANLVGTYCRTKPGDDADPQMNVMFLVCISPSPAQLLGDI